MYPALTLDDAYQVTALANGLRLAQGHKPVGRKIGFTNSRLWDEYGVRAPIWGYVYDRTLHDLGAAFSLAPLAEPRIEPEIMLGLAKAPSPGMDDAALLSCVAWVAHGFEIVQSIYPGWKFTAADSVAANGLHGALLIARATRSARRRMNGCAHSQTSRSNSSATADRWTRAML